MGYSKKGSTSSSSFYFDGISIKILHFVTASCNKVRYIVCDLIRNTVS